MPPLVMIRLPCNNLAPLNQGAYFEVTMTQDSNVVQDRPENILPVENHLQLGFLVADWHRNIGHHLLAVIQAPDDIDLNVQFDGADQPELITDPRERALFKLGVEYALNQFLNLPFTMEEDPNETQTTGDGSKL